MRLLFLLLTLSLTWAEEDAKLPASAEQALAAYDAEIGKAKAEYEKKEAVATRALAAALEKAQMAETKAGNLDGAVAIRDRLRDVTDALTVETDLLGNPIPRGLSLTTLPIKRKYAPVEITINSNPDNAAIQIGGRECKSYIFAHATSTMLFDIPAGSRLFKAVGTRIPGKQLTGNWKYVVFIDGKQAFESPELGSNAEVPISVKIPAEAKEIELKIDDMGPNDGDQSVWANPVFEK